MSTHVRIVIDGQVVTDDDLDTWVATPPDYFKDLLRPDARPEPWLKSIMVMMADAAMNGTSLDITVVTAPGRWSMEVVTDAAESST